MKTHTIVSQFQKIGLLLALTLVVPASVPSSSMAGPHDHARACHRVELKGTITSQFNYTFMGWEGRALISINGGEARWATMVTTGSPPQFKEDGAPYGTEINQFIFEDGSGSFEVSGPWESSWSGTPGLLDYYSVAQLGKGTGDYAGITGTVVTVGPFLMPTPPSPNLNTLFIGEMYGLVRGLAQ
jgi:hypothetical protein